MSRLTRFLAVPLSVLLCVGTGVSAVAADDLEYRVKAAFLYNFARFVEWPDAASKGSAPIHVCTYLSDPFGDSLNATLKDKTINGRTVTPRNVASVQEAVNCEILFVSDDLADDDSRFLLGELSGKSVLTVGEGLGFNRNGGIVRFLIEDGKVRFEINLDAARQSGLKVSSKLLKVAKTVEGSGGS